MHRRSTSSPQPTCELSYRLPSPFLCAIAIACPVLTYTCPVLTYTCPVLTCTCPVLMYGTATPGSVLTQRAVQAGVSSALSNQRLSVPLPRAVAMALHVASCRDLRNPRWTARDMRCTLRRFLLRVRAQRRELRPGMSFAFWRIAWSATRVAVECPTRCLALT